MTYIPMKPRQVKELLVTFLNFIISILYTYNNYSTEGSMYNILNQYSVPLNIDLKLDMSTL